MAEESVYCEPVSTGKFPVKPEKPRLLSIRSRFPFGSPSECPQSQYGTVEFPLPSNREPDHRQPGFLVRRAGSIARHRGILESGRRSAQPGRSRVMSQETEHRQVELPPRPEITLCEAVTSIVHGKVLDSVEYMLKAEATTE